jgi:cellulose synthase/poly-beta-1,6-N-acetylglucosamine synthase-like glycosyltransferase
MHPDNTVICQVKISRAAMKAAQEAAKLQSTCKGKKNNIFLHISKASVSTLVAFFFSNIIIFNFFPYQEHTIILTTTSLPIHYNLLSPKAIQKFPLYQDCWNVVLLRRFLKY